MTFLRPTPRSTDRLAVGLGVFVGFAGVAHFLSPDFFDDIVPPWLPPGERFWTNVSGVAELVVAALLLVPRWRHLGGLAAIALFIGVYPANIYMAWEWRDRPLDDQLVAYGRLPLQFVLIWFSSRVAARNTDQPLSPR